MKILLDQCVTKKLKQLLAGHAVFTVTEMKWNGLRNGVLMTKAVEQIFDVLLTIDKNILFQQNAGKYNLVVVVLDTKSSKIEALQNFIPQFEKLLPDFEKRKGYIISS